MQKISINETNELTKGLLGGLFSSELGLEFKQREGN